MIFFRVIVSPLDANKTAFRFVGEEKKGWQAFGSQGCTGAGWSSLAARRAHNPKVVGSNPAPATKNECESKQVSWFVVIALSLGSWRDNLKKFLETKFERAWFFYF